MHRTSGRARRGFTILELLIVIGILIALGGIVIYNLTGQSEKADKGIQLSQMQMIKKAVMMFRNDVKRLPTEEEGIVVLWDKSALDEEVAARWQGPYLEEAIPNDIWGRELKYVPTEDSSFGFDLVSVGPDGEEGTADDITLAKLGAEGDMGGSSGSSSGSSGTGGTR